VVLYAHWRATLWLVRRKTEEWLESKAEYDPADPTTYNNAQHRFMSSRGTVGCACVRVRACGAACDSYSLTAGLTVPSGTPFNSVPQQRCDIGPLLAAAAQGREEAAKR
jgi:hypothetical protein